MAKKRQYGSIRRLPSGKWQARYLDRLTSRMVPAPSTFATRGDASRWLAAMESGAINATTAAAMRRDDRFEEYATAWVAARKLRPRTRELYEGQLRLHILPILGSARVARIEPRDIREWYAATANGHLSDVSVAKAYRLLRSILATAVEDGLLARNPCQVKHGGVERSPERMIPTVLDVERLSAALPDRLRLVPWMAAAAGLRRGEIFGLARRHISLESGTLRVERALQEINGVGAEFVAPKTVSGIRTVIMPTRLVELTTVHLVEFVAPGDDALLFTNGKGRPIRSMVWADAWTGARRATGMQSLHLHDLRHLAGTLNAQAGATLRESMQFLGHSSPRAALRYQHAAGERAAEIARRMDGLL